MRLRPLSVLVLATLIALAPRAFAAEDTVLVGSVSSVNGVKLSVAVSPAGSALLATPTNPQFVNPAFLEALAAYLGDIGAEMRNLKARTILGRDYVELGRIPFARDGSMGREGLAFRFELDEAAAEKVLLRLNSTITGEVLLLDLAAVGNLRDLSLKAVQYVEALKEQRSYLLTMAGRLTGTAGRAP